MLIQFNRYVIQYNTPSKKIILSHEKCHEKLSINYPSNQRTLFAIKKLHHPKKKLIKHTQII